MPDNNIYNEQALVANIRREFFQPLPQGDKLPTSAHAPSTPLLPKDSNQPGNYLSNRNVHSDRKADVTPPPYSYAD